MDRFVKVDVDDTRIYSDAANARLRNTQRRFTNVMVQVRVCVASVIARRILM
jgi:hypothetical protein